MITKFCEIKATTEGRKLFFPKNGNWTNQRLANRTSKPMSKRTDSSLAKKGPFRGLVF